MWRKNKHLTVLLLLAFVFGALSLLTSTASATTGVSPDVSFEGKIVNSSGVNITNATYNVEFTMYTGCSNEPTNNTGCTLAWTEDYLTSATQGVAMNGGTFEVNLGQYCAFSGGTCQGNTNSGINWNTYPIYMSMQIGQTTNCTPAGNFTTNCTGDSVMQPYILMTSTPYAQNASTLGGLGSGSFAQLGTTQTFTGSNTFETNSASALTVENTSTQALLTINTSTPTVNLGVTGSVALGSTVTINNSSGGIELTNIGSTALSSATVLQGGSGSLSLTTGTAAGNITLTTNNAASSVIAKSSTNNTTALEVQNASSQDVLNVDTQNAQVDVGALSAPGTLTATQAPLAGSLTGTAGSTSYTYEITAVSANGAESLAATETNAALANSITTHNITVNYTTNGAAYYKIYRTASAGTPSSLGLVGTSTTGSFVDTGYTAGAQAPALANTGSLAVSTNYYYEVTALDDTYTTTDNIGQTPPSTQLTATTNSYNKSLTINWAPVNGARAYNVYRSTTSGTYTTDSYYTVYTNSFTDTNTVATGTNTTPPTTSTAYSNTISDNANANVTIGDNGTETGQLYVGGQSPILVANITDTGVPQGDYVVGSYLYVANPANNTLQIFNISNPSNPVLVGTSATTGLNGPTSVAVAGQYAYLTNNSSNTLAILNVSNPSNPVLASTVVVGLAGSAPDTNYVQGDYDYVTTEGGNTLAIVDVSNPSNPILDSSIAAGIGPLGVVAQGNYVYVSDSGASLVQIYNVANPYSPTLVSTITTSGGGPRGIVSGSYAYITNGAGAMQVFDISNPADPVVVGSVATVAGGGHLFSQGHYVYVDGSNGSNGYLEAFDVSNPADPILVGTPTTITNTGFGVFYVQGRYAYAVNTGSTYTLAVFDLGGAYIQQLQVGGTETGTLQVDSNANVSGSESITSGLTVGSSAQIAGNTGLSGNLTVAGTTQLEGITTINGVYGGYSSIGLATPAAPSITFSGTTGGAVTWSYEVEAIDAAGNTTAASPVGSITTGDSNGLGTYSSETVSSVTFATPHVTYNVPSGQPYLTGMGIVVSSCSGTGADNGTYTITSETTSTIVVSNASGVAGETGCTIAAENNYNTISWSAVTGAVNYYVFRTTDAAGGSPSTTGFIGSTTGTSLTDNATAGTATYLAQTTDSTNSFIDKTATNSTTAFSVQNSAGSSVLNVDTTNAQVDVGALTAPGTLTATQAPLAGSLTGTAGSTSYTYEITAVSANGAESLAATETNAALANSITTHNITVNYTTNGAAYYKIYRTASAGTPSSLGLVGTSTTGSFVDTGYTAGAQAPALANTGSLAVSTNYYYEVTALDDTYTTTDNIGQTPPSTQLTATTNSYNKSLTINWAPVNGARAYNVYRSTTSGVFTTDSYYTVYTNSLTDTNTGATGTNTVPPTVSTAYSNTISDNANANVTIGDSGTETGQLYVGGQLAVDSVINTGVGSDSCGVAVQGDYAYVTNYSTDTFQVYNISNPDNPVLLSSQSVTGACGVSIEGDYAYVLDYSSSYLDVFNISNPTDPLEVSSVPTNTTPTSLDISGRYAYITNAGTDTLQVFDISNPTNPVVVDSVATGAFPNDVYVQGSYAYVINTNDDTMQIFNISNPTNIPAALSTSAPYTVGADAQAISVQGAYAYVAENSASEMQVFDISNPYTQIPVGSFTTNSQPSGIYVQGRYAYLAENNTSVQAVDISNPADPLNAGSVGLGTQGGTGRTPDIITVQGRYAYMLGGATGNNLQIIDLGGAYIQQLQAGGIETGTLDVDSNANVSGDGSIVGGLTVGGATELAGNVGVGGDVVIGNSSSVNNNATTGQQLYVSGVANPTFVSQSTTTNLNYPRGLAVSGNYAYVVSTSGSELVSYDLSSGTPVYVGENGTNLNAPEGISVQGNYAYVASYGNNEMVIFNISSGIPVYVSEIGTDLNNPTIVQVEGDYAYVVNYSNDYLVVFNISNPAHPTFTGVNTDSHVTGSYGLAVDGSYAYVTSIRNNELVVYNISSGTPVYVGESNADSSNPNYVVVQGNYAYVTMGGGSKLVTYDIASGTPVLVGENSDSNLNNPTWLAIQGNYAYVSSDGNNKIVVYDVSSGIPVYVGENTDSSIVNTEDVAVQGNYVYVTSGGNNELIRYNLSGEYAQQLQVGGEEVSQLQVDTNENVSGNASITGGLIVGSSAQVSGGLGVNGALDATGSVVVDASYTGLPSPTISGTSTATTGGSLTAATYYYEITALDATGNETTPSAQVSQVTTGSTSTVTLTWAPITGAESYNIYRSTTSGVYTTDSVYATQGTVSGSNLTFTDTGTTAPITNTAPPILSSGQLPAVVQQTDGANTGTATAVFGSNTTVGNTVVLMAQVSSGTDVVGSVTGGGVSTWTKISNASYDTGGYDTEMWYGTVTAAGSTTITVVESGGGTDNVRLIAAEVFGVISSPVDQASATTYGTTSNPTTPTIVTTSPNEIIFGWDKDGAGGSSISSPTNGFTALVQPAPYNMLAYFVASSTGNYSTSFTATPTSSGGAVGIVSFKITSPTAQVATNTSNSNLQVTIGGNGTPTGQLYVSGTVPTSAIGTVSTGTSPNYVAVEGSYAYVINNGTNAMQVISVANPAAPVVVSTITIDSSPNNIYVQGNYVYVTNWADILQIINVSNPDSPVVVGAVTASGAPISVFVQGNYAYVTDYGGVFQIINVSNPANPVAVAATNTGTTPNAVYVQGNYAYVTNGGSNSLQIINVSDPSAPFNVSTTTTDSDPTSIYVQGIYAYIAGASGNLQIINISDPESPVVVGSLGSSTTGGSIYVQGNYAYVTGWGSSFAIINIANSSNPEFVGSVPTGTGSGAENGIVVQGRYAYDSNGGSNTLQVFDLGGEYSQQLQAGGAEVGTLQVDSNANISGGESITGGLSVGGATQLAGSVSAGSFSISDGLATPATPTETATCASTCTSTYSYAVAATNSSGSSAVSSSSSLASDNATLNTTTNYIQTTWSSVGGASSYNVYRGGYAQAYLGHVAGVTGLVTGGSTSGFTYIDSPSNSGNEMVYNLNLAANTTYAPTSTNSVATTYTASGIVIAAGATHSITQPTGFPVAANGDDECSPNLCATYTMPHTYATVGDLAVLLYHYNSTNINITSITGTQSGTWALRLRQLDANTGKTQDIWTAPVTATSSADVLTITYSGSVGGINGNIWPDSLSSGLGTGAVWSFTTGPASASYSPTTTINYPSITSSPGNSQIGTVYSSATATPITPTSASETTTTLTLNFASPPPWAVGQAVTLASFTTAAVNGTWPVLSVTPTSITVNIPGGITRAITVGPGTATGQLAFYDTGQTAGSAAPTVATAGTLTLQSTSKAALLVENASSVAELSVDTQDGIVIIGSGSSTNTTQTLLQLNSDATYSEAASCSTTTNQGSLYYNNVTNNIRACINGNWQDLVSTQDLALQLFGVVPNSGSNPGDLIGASATATAYTGGPCKVTYSSTTSVNVASCLAYSGGREVSVANTNVPIGTVALNNYENICLNSSGVPVAMGGVSATDGNQTAANLTNTNATTLSAPLLCLATIKASGTANQVGIIYDIRTFSTTIKTYGTLASATQVLGGLVGTGGAGFVANTTTATSNVVGVLVAGTNATAAAGTLNVLYATIGPQWIKNTGTALQADYIIPTTTTGYASALTTTAATAYDQIGINQAGTFGATCTGSAFGAADCQQSVFTDLDIQ